MGTRGTPHYVRADRSGKKGRLPETIESVNARWKNRRRMAWGTFLATHFLILYIVVYTPAVEAYSSIINTFFMFSGAILGAYLGFSTFDDVKNRESDNSKAYETTDVSELDER